MKTFEGTSDELGEEREMPYIERKKKLSEWED